MKVTLLKSALLVADVVGASWAVRAMGVGWWVLPVGFVVWIVLIGIIELVRGRPSWFSSEEVVAAYEAGQWGKKCGQDESAHNA